MSAIPRSRKTKKNTKGVGRQTDLGITRERASCRRAAPFLLTARPKEKRMPSKGSVTGWLGQAQAGDAEAAQQLWQRYFGRLVALARVKLRGSPRGMADEEDVALSAFDSFYRRAERGQFARLEDRDDLWQILVVITERKALGLLRYEGRKSRAHGRTVSLSQSDGAEGEAARDPAPSPEFAAQVADEYRRLLKLLGDDSLRSVALWKMEGYTNAEIAKRLGCVEATVERKLRSIRRLWEGAQPS
jgi:DNA-directed RNA polymerase specialized sigma24 family protein